MDKLTRGEILTLGEARGPAVSIYLPTDPLGQSGEADSRRLGNLLREAREGLEAAGMRGPAAREILGPAEDLLADGLFWSHQSRGLALFLAPEQARRLRLPLDFGELAVAGPRFHVRPLLPLLAGNGGFFLLAASENGARIFEGGRDGLEELDLPGAPAGVRAANQYEARERYLGFHSGAPQRGGRYSAMFYGIGSRADEAKGDTEEYARQLADALDAALGGENLPLVLCGVESLCAMLRARLRYRQVEAEELGGNPDDLSTLELHARAWPLIERRIAAEAEQALARYREQAGTGATASGVEAVSPAAADGRVRSLFLKRGESRWTRDELSGGRVELLDRAAVQTLEHGGEVWELPALPDQAPLCALLRY